MAFGLGREGRGPGNEVEVFTLILQLYEIINNDEKSLPPEHAFSSAANLEDALVISKWSLAIWTKVANILGAVHIERN